jgi:hypothetical protein
MTAPEIELAAFGLIFATGWFLGWLYATEITLRNRR